ncbi:hypothetical protein [Candidatus Aalborgicola defluviihabitans]|uniref:hypothetical protein n=1 Tax=Candidatus Aalborgicola defluviihabitans TaxID=3386187 RepID=UPI001D37BF83|nr:hypothetical protein [Burkholderiales bacterium]
MNRFLFPISFAMGLVAVIWVGVGFIGSSALALAMTLAIAGVYLLGAHELRLFRAATTSLATALTDIPHPLVALGTWLERLPSSLQNAVRLRVESERGALPGPALTPYLVGLLVMLGMLGTFLGMVVTFKGAVFALEGSTDLQAIRTAMAAPIKGLGLSFGTSVAGVAASAMLGLMSAISRRERSTVARNLDSKIATVLRPFSHAHHREETLQALQAQTRALPNVVDRLTAMMEQIEQRNQQLNESLTSRQDQFHREVAVAYTGLADDVGRSLRDSLVESSTLASESIKPVVEAAMADMARESRLLHERTSESAQAQLSGLTTSLRDAWRRAGQQTLEQQQGICQTLVETAGAITGHTTEHANRAMGGISRLLERAETLVSSRIDAEADWMKHQGDRMDQLASLWRKELGALRDDEASRGHTALERLGELQAALALQLATLGAALEAPLERLMQTAAEAPKAAAELITQLRKEMTHATKRNAVALQERTDLMERMSALLDAAGQTALEQRAAIDSLVASAATALDKTGNRFEALLGVQADNAKNVVAHVSGSAIELSSLGESFHLAVKLFNDSNNKLIESLQRIEGAVSQSMLRSDEQLAYYVGQAREVIDLSLTSQKAVVEDLRRLHSKSIAHPEGSL